MREADFQRTVIDAARKLGWRVVHFRAAQDRHGRWKTPVQGDGVGWPDLVLWHPAKGGLMMRELKVDAKVTAEQEVCIDSLRAAGVDAGVWRPADWDLIEAELKVNTGRPRHLPPTIRHYHHFTTFEERYAKRGGNHG